jgi:hypothetical protein
VVAELPEKLMSCRFLPMSCWFLAHAAGRLLGMCSRVRALLGDGSFFRCRGAWPRRCGFPDAGEFPNQAGLARALGFSRERISNVLGLLLLAPDIQKEILFLECLARRGNRPQ